MGIDRDEDGVLDADIPAPILNIAKVPGAAVLHWPFSAAGFLLEQSPFAPSLNWSNVLDPWVIVGDQNYVTNAFSGSSGAFRLHQTAP